MPVPLYLLSPNVTFRELFGVIPLQLTHDWFGGALPHPISIFLGEANRTLLFGAASACPPWCGGEKQGDFVEGLWERDVVELFLGEKGTARYQEFNLSPRGAWWTVGLSAYRVRMATRAMPGVRCFAESHGDGWRAGISIPLDELTISWSASSGAAVNVTAIQGNPQRFITAIDLGGGEPDFHRTERFIAPQLVREGRKLSAE